MEKLMNSLELVVTSDQVLAFSAEFSLFHQPVDVVYRQVFLIL